MDASSGGSEIICRVAVVYFVVVQSCMYISSARRHCSVARKYTCVDKYSPQNKT